MKSQKGMSLILVMVGISIVSIILLAVFRLLDMSRDMAASFQNVIKAMDAMQEVRFSLADAATCTFNLQGTLVGTAGSPTTLTRELAFPPKAVWVAINGQIEQAKLLASASSATVTTPAVQTGYNPSEDGGLAPTNTDSPPIITWGGSNTGTIVLERITLSEPPVATPNTAMINIEMSRRSGTTTVKLRTRSIPVWIKQDATGRVTCCSTRNISLCP